MAIAAGRGLPALPAAPIIFGNWYKAAAGPRDPRGMIGDGYLSAAISKAAGRRAIGLRFVLESAAKCGLPHYAEVDPASCACGVNRAQRELRVRGSIDRTPTDSFLAL